MPTRTKFVILMHPYEHKRVKANTGRLTHLCLADSELHLGIGFDEQYHDRIFQLFQRLHGKAEFGGTGIGLAICKKIIERHDGRMYARSRPGEGATFIVELPLHQKPSAEKTPREP